MPPVIRQYSQRYPLLLPSIASSSGILLSAFGPPASELLYPLLLLIVLCFFNIPQFKGKRGVLLISLISLLYGWGFVEKGLHQNLPTEIQEWTQQKSRIQILIQAKEYCQVGSKSSRFSAKLLGWYEEDKFRPLHLGIQITIPETECSVLPGEVYRTYARFRLPQRFQNPHSFDYPFYLKTRGVMVLARVDAVAWLSLAREAPIFYRMTAGVRREILASLKSYISLPESRGVLQELLVGVTAEMPQKTAELFRKTGLTHVLVISGLHFSLLLLLFYFPLYFLFSLSTKLSNNGLARIIPLGIALFPLIFYALMVGMTPSVLRSVGTSVFIVLALILRWKRKFVSLFLLVFFLLLLSNPFFLLDLSFQLSFLSVAAIYFFPRTLIHWKKTDLRQWWQRGIFWIGISLYSTMAVNLVLFPLLAHTFHQVSLIAPICNLLFVPIFTILVLPLGLLGVGFIYFRPEWGEIILSILEKIISFVIQVMEKLAALPFAAWNVGSLSPIHWCAYLLLMIGLLLIPRWKKGLFCGSISVLLFSLPLLIPEKVPNRLRLTMFDVGQGESMLLSLPNGEEILIDGGGFPYSDFDLGKNVVFPELMEMRVRSLDAVVMTHPDADHMKGLFYLMDQIPIKEFWFSDSFYLHSDFSSLKNQAIRQSVRLKPLMKGAEWKNGAVSFEVLWPPEELPINQADWEDNDQSLVIRVCYQQICFLLTGDVEARGEMEIFPFLKSSQVLKVAHHGSATSSTWDFLEKVNPQLAILSAGRDNRYHLPHPDVIKRLEERGIKILRTDQNGMIEVSTDGKSIFYQTFISAPIPTH